MQLRRLRDPIHDLIGFNVSDDSGIDRLAWELLNKKEFQRLRRVRQLGLSEFVFPGATHSRFSHSIGVFHNARKLMTVLERETGTIDKDKERVVLIAALLHDLGHGPFSHAFENARESVALERGGGAIKKHEKWSAMLIRSKSGEIAPILGDALANQVAKLIEADDPSDIYHAVVSSSFDADRLDYVVRDRYMTGVGAGAIDQSWLIDNLTTCNVTVQQDNEPSNIRTFVFKLKGRQAAEDFLLARYRLYSQIYLHKTTRGFEQLVTALFKHIGSETTDLEKLGLAKNNPLANFLRTQEYESNDEYTETRVGLFLRLDDYKIWSTIEQISICADKYAAELAHRLIWRKPLKVIDVSAKLGHDPETRINAEERLDSHVLERLNRTVFKDRAPLNLYSRIGGEMSKEHKKVRVLNGDGKALEIHQFPETIISDRLTKKDNLVRYYFLDQEECSKALKAMVGT
jgi:hypothetical protein